MAMVFAALPSLAAGEDALKAADAKLAAGQTAEALRMYESVMAADPRNVGAMCGAASGYQSLKQPAKAVAVLERAFAAAPKDRVVVQNLAVALFETKAQPRALRLLSDYLSAGPRQPDEPALNALLYLLDTAAPETKSTKVHADAAAVAKQYGHTLETRQPKFRRWGVEWLPADTVKAYEAKLQSQPKESGKFDKQLKADDDAIRALEERKPKLEERIARGLDRETERDVLAGRIEDAKKRKAQHEADRDALTGVPKPAAAPAPQWLAFGTPAPALTKPAGQVAQAPNSTPAPMPTPPPAPTQRPGVPESPHAQPPVRSTEPPPEPPAKSGRPDLIQLPPDNEMPAAPATSSPEESPADASAPADSTPHKRTTVYGVAFAVSNDTLVVSRALVDGALEIVVQSPNGASESCKVEPGDASNPLALLKIKTLKAAPLPVAAEFAGGAVQCVGVPTPDMFRVDAEVIDGSATKPGAGWTVKLDKNPRLPGAPLLAGGKIVGVTLATRDTDPAAVPAIALPPLRELIGNAAATKDLDDPKQAIFQLIVTREVNAD